MYFWIGHDESNNVVNQEPIEEEEQAVKAIQTGKLLIWEFSLFFFKVIHYNHNPYIK